MYNANLVLILKFGAYIEPNNYKILVYITIKYYKIIVFIIIRLIH